VTLTAPDPAHPDTLGTNKSLLVGQSLTSADGTTVLTLQADGNLVLTYNGKTLWTSGTAGKPVALLSMKWDGFLHLKDNAGTVYWGDGASGHKDAFLRVNNGGLMMVWDGSNHQIWDSGTSGGKVNPVPGAGGAAHTDFGGIDQFLKEAANTCGSVLNVLAPIAAVVVNIIPGIGQAASLAICAGIAAATAGVKAAAALANKTPGALNAVLSAVASVVPGGSDPAVQAAIDVGSTAVTQAASGHPDPSALISAAANIPGIPPQIQTALDTTGQLLGSGLPISAPQVTAAMQALPPGVQAGMHIGALTGNSAVIGASTTPDASTLTAFEHLGLQREATDPVAVQGRLLAGAGTRGFDIGIGCTLNHISPGNLTAVRNELPSADQKGFDMALALHIGNMIAPPPPPGTNASATAAYAITRGMGSHDSDAKASIMGNIAASPGARPGAVVAVKAIANEKHPEGWFHHLLRILGLVS
jgi:hypothetical protein